MEGTQFKELLSTLSKNKKFDAHKADKIVDGDMEIQATDKATKKVTIKNPESVVLKSDSPVSSHSSEGGESNVDVGETIAVAGAVSAAGVAANSIVGGGFFDGYYTIFGFQISKTTVFIGIAFVLLLVCYYIYRAWYGKKSDKNNNYPFQRLKRARRTSFSGRALGDHATLTLIFVALSFLPARWIDSDSRRTPCDGVTCLHSLDC